MEAKVFEEENFARLEIRFCLFGSFADAVFNEFYRLADLLGKFFGDGFEGEFRRNLTVRASEVRGENDCRTVVERVLNRRERRDNALRIGNRAGYFVLRDIEVNADEHAFAVNIDITNCFSCHDVFVDN